MQPRERMRKHKFTEAELAILIEEVTHKEDMLFGLQGNGMTTYEKNKLWVDIAHRLYAVSGMQRTISEIKRRWQDLKRRTKQKVEDAKLHIARNSPTSSLYLTAMEQKVYGSLNIHTIVKQEDIAQPPLQEETCHARDTGSSEYYEEESSEQKASGLQTHTCQDPSGALQTPPHTYAEQSSSSPFGNQEISPEGSSTFSRRNKVEPAASEGSPARGTAQGSYPALRGHLKAWSGMSCNKTVPLGSFEQQLLRAHREHTAALKDGFRTLTRQNRLIYREMCETNKNIARIASCLAEKNESVSDLAEELVGIHHKITESIDATNCLQDRVIDLLASQQERSVFVVPSAVKAPVPTSSIVEQENTARREETM
ncbi:myb-related transcription factor, partner of profilin-like [Lepisosteus oculatus]|uniref:myb-related transcription factor, partner of profilin-like n=1 Tax=Lepisosteus oculatus TaxID=7918 RepID=UPI0037108344